MSASKKPRRRNSLRKQGWDYRNPGYYFVTILTYKRVHFFEVLLIKQKVEEIIAKIPMWEGSQHVTVVEFVVMPDHIHLLLFLDETLIREQHDRPNTAPNALGTVIGTFKRRVTKELKPLWVDEPYRVWHRGYYDRIVRNEPELHNIQRYIQLNPARWDEKGDNVDQLLGSMIHRR